MTDRIIRIFDVLTEKKRIKINSLAEVLDVSQVTLPRDLDILEKKDIICRTHGYVSLDGADVTAKRMAFSYPIKRRIARAAAQTIREGETILLDSGSCCALLCEELAATGKRNTIISNSIYIANYVRHMPNIKMLLLGGQYQPESQTLVGSLTVKCAQNFYTDKFFLGVNGFIPDFGFSCRDLMRAETANELTKYTKKVFILTESAKFQQRGAFNLLQFEKITGIFTDDKIPKEAEEKLIKNNVKVNKVSSVNESYKMLNNRSLLISLRKLASRGP